VHGVSIQTLTPIDDEKCEVVHTYYAKTSEPAGKAELEGFFDYYASDWELDFGLWNEKVYRPQPLLAENDGDVGRFRRWYKQFYSTDVGIDNSGHAATQVNWSGPSPSRWAARSRTCTSRSTSCAGTPRPRTPSSRGSRRSRSASRTSGSRAATGCRCATT
jgi:hypothetical protein